MPRPQSHRSVTEGAEYERWVDFLRRFGKGEAGLAPIAEPFPEATGQRAVARLAGHAVDAVNARLELWSKQVQRALSAATNHHEVERALVKSRSDLAVVWEFVQNAQLPDSIMTALRDMVRDAIEQTQTALEQQLERQPDAQLTLAIRRADLRSVLRGEVKPLASPERTRRPTAGNGRRILIAKRSEIPRPSGPGKQREDRHP